MNHHCPLGKVKIRALFPFQRVALGGVPLDSTGQTTFTTQFPQGRPPFIYLYLNVVPDSQKTTRVSMEVSN